MTQPVTSKQDLIDKINWETVLAAPRYAGGHEEVFRALYEGRATVLDVWVEEGYEGMCAAAYLFPDGAVAIITDYFGSCAGCDEWEAYEHDDAKIRDLILAMARNARVWPSIEEAERFCATETKDAENFSFKTARNLKLRPIQ